MFSLCLVFPLSILMWVKSTTGPGLRLVFSVSQWKKRELLTPQVQTPLHWPTTTTAAGFYLGVSWALQLKNDLCRAQLCSCSPKHSHGEHCVGLQAAHSISRQAGRKFLIFLPRGCEGRLPWGSHCADPAQPTHSGLSDHCLPVLFLASFPSIATEKGNLMRSGAATRQRATSASMAFPGMGEGKMHGLKLQPGGQRGQFLSHTHRRPASIQRLEFSIYFPY